MFPEVGLSFWQQKQDNVPMPCGQCHGRRIGLRYRCPREIPQEVLQDKCFGGTRAAQRVFIGQGLGEANLGYPPEVLYREDGGAF